MKKPFLACSLVVLAALALVAAAVAQDYSIGWWKVAGGGGTSTGGVFAVSGTIGQADAGGPLTNGPYSLTGGFWALPTLVQTPDAPTLHVTNAAPGFATLWWMPPTPGFTLQSIDSLAPTNWVNAPSGTNNPATVPLVAPTRFYRLFKPGA
jgi:opacity protein-like surface antigen